MVSHTIGVKPQSQKLFKTFNDWWKQKIIYKDAKRSA